VWNSTPTPIDDYLDFLGVAGDAESSLVLVSLFESSVRLLLVLEWLLTLAAPTSFGFGSGAGEEGASVRLLF